MRVLIPNRMNNFKEMFALKYEVVPQRMCLWRCFEEGITYTLFKVPPIDNIDERYLIHERHPDHLVLAVRNYTAKRMPDSLFDVETGFRIKSRREDTSDYRRDETEEQKEERKRKQREYERQKREAMSEEERIRRRVYMRNYMRRRNGVKTTRKEVPKISPDERYATLFMKVEAGTANEAEELELIELQEILDSGDTL